MAEEAGGEQGGKGCGPLGGGEFGGRGAVEGVRVVVPPGYSRGVVVVGSHPPAGSMPGMTGISNVSPEDPAQKVGAFSEHQLWVTPYNPDEFYAAGLYVTSS